MKNQFRKYMRLFKKLNSLRGAAYCLMPKHFHFLVEVPKRLGDLALPEDEGLIRHVAN